ncbi:type II toxin-antitoxin system HipA family toxin [Corynebacterium renale]|uniref:Serine/threonine-protein kinase HipA n=1 Tax=Corynebacterium renale TaxID=1724 RepID=A0A2A9DR45_9CORY|nr:HipA domain-containing protein [Corynebacterium renale]PFG28836.1 serine/threonine-protein kinase HipA [Corynebacterium renale]SQI25674.1 uncharacterized protein related to capsule biosynthesis enzyme [Corynebacterium renale]STC95609.1 uncharacterized protein related to capsule biosynthesis enzyme [Corynebacterium renale]
MATFPGVEQLRFINKADVYKAGVLAGHIYRNDVGATTFFYAESYSGPSIATTLPVSTEPLSTMNGALPPFFSGLLPEGHRLSVLRRAVKTSFDDELSLLLAVGRDVPGDVLVVPDGYTPQPVEAAIDIAQTDVRFQDVVDLADAVGIPGVQAKASASMANRPVTAHGRHAILKIDPPEHPYLVVNEALHLRHAAALKMPVAEFEVVHDSEGTPGLLVSRFDRTDDGKARALEDGAQVLGIPPAKKYSVEATDVVLALAEHTEAPIIAARSLYVQFMFAWLTGNGDLHAKNMSILQNERGRWEISPIYDIPCTAMYGDMTMALPIAGRTKKIRLRHWDEFAESIGLPVVAARSANALALKAAQSINIAQLPFHGSPLYAAERELRLRRYEIA